MVKSPPHILVVDDDVVILKFIEFTLKGLGYKTTLAQNGKEAIEKAQQQLFDLIISDLYMPLMDGNQLVRQLRKTPEYRHTPFIFLSGNTEEETWIKNLNDGADDFITKPIKQKVFVSKIKAHLKKAYLRKDILDSSRRNNVSFERGIIIYCADRTKPFPLPHKHIKTSIKVVYTDTDFFLTLQELNIWGIIIDENAEWATQILEKITEIVSYHVPVNILISNYEDQSKMEQYVHHRVSGFMYKGLNTKLLAYQINTKVQREMDLKNKYLTALNMAAKKSPIRFENDYSDSLSNYSIQILHQPYDKLPGGDYYEVFNVNDDKKILILGDVMGKKWDAWFFVPAYIAYIRSTINFFANRKELDFIENPGKFLEIINQYVFKDIQLSEVFTTLCIISLCTSTSKVSIASAGALRPFYFNKAEGNISQLNIVGTLLGVLQDTSYQSLVQKFSPGDKLLFFTDGYTEATNDKSGEMIGDDPLGIVLKKHHLKTDLSPRYIEEELIKTYNVSKFDDDRTLLLIGHN
ncbi:MAG: response regulator [Marinifilaceae bacterium]